MATVKEHIRRIKHEMKGSNNTAVWNTVTPCGFDRIAIFSITVAICGTCSDNVDAMPSLLGGVIQSLPAVWRTLP